MPDHEAAASQILASITYHCLVLDEDLTYSQWQEHKRRASCPVCDRTPLAEVPKVLVKQGGGT